MVTLHALQNQPVVEREAGIINNIIIIISGIQESIVTADVNTAAD